MHNLLEEPELDTPCLLVDLDRLDRNLRTMADLAGRHHVELWPHSKTHKMPLVARRQMELGAAGVSCAKLGEAEVMVTSAGIRDIFIAYPLVGIAKLRRLVRLARLARVAVGVDSIHVAQPIAEAATAAGVTIGVLVEVEVGLGRGGVPPAGVVDLVRMLTKQSGIQVDGIYSYGGYSGGSDPVVKAQWAQREAEIMVETAERLRAQGLPCRRVSVGGTPLTPYFVGLPGITEVRPGTYVFGDGATVARAAMDEDDVALTVAARVIGRPTVDVAIIDAGTKAIENQRWPEASPDAGWARVWGHPASRVTKTWEEHGVLQLDESLAHLRIGDVVRLVPNHVCPVVNLFEYALAVRADRIAGTIPIAARGKSQ